MGEGVGAWARQPVPEHIAYRYEKIIKNLLKGTTTRRRILEADHDSGYTNAQNQEIMILRLEFDDGARGFAEIMIEGAPEEDTTIPKVIVDDDEGIAKLRTAHLRIMFTPKQAKTLTQFATELTDNLLVERRDDLDNDDVDKLAAGVRCMEQILNMAFNPKTYIPTHSIWDWLIMRDSMNAYIQECLEEAGELSRSSNWLRLLADLTEVGEVINKSLRTTDIDDPRLKGGDA